MTLQRTSTLWYLTLFLFFFYIDFPVQSLEGVMLVATQKRLICGIKKNLLLLKIREKDHQVASQFAESSARFVAKEAYK